MRLSVACFLHSLSSEAVSSGVWGVAGLTQSREVRDGILMLEQGVAVHFPGVQGWFSLCLVDGAAFPGSSTCFPWAIAAVSKVVLWLITQILSSPLCVPRKAV